MLLFSPITFVLSISLEKFLNLIIYKKNPNNGTCAIWLQCMVSYIEGGMQAKDT
jgi:hypothetical protein